MKKPKWINDAMDWVGDSVHPVIIVAIIVTFIVVFFTVLFGVPKKPEVKVEATVSAVESALPKYTAHDGIAVLLRAYPAVTKVCESNNQYFIYFEPDKEENWSGWYHVISYDFKQLANGSWYHADMAASNFEQVLGFESKGLECDTKTLQ